MQVTMQESKHAKRASTEACQARIHTNTPSIRAPQASKHASERAHQPQYNASKSNMRFIRLHLAWLVKLFQSAFTCSKLALETLEQGVKYVQSQQYFIPCCNVSIAKFEHVITGWVTILIYVAIFLLEKYEKILLSQIFEYL